MRLIAAQFTIANTWEQPKGPLTDEWIKTWYIYTTECYSTIKKNAVMPFAAIWLDLEIIILSDVKSHRERQLLYDIIYMQNLTKKMIQVNLFTRQKQTHRLTKQTMATRGEGWGLGIV